MLSLRVALLVALLAGCSRGKQIPLRVQVCGFLCGDHSDGTRLSNDYSGIACAESVHIRALDAANPANIVAGSCIDLRNAQTQFQDLFDDVLRPAPGRPAPLPNLPAVGRVIFEVALYPPLESSPCADGSPLVGEGRSAIVDLEHPPESIVVPLGCHEICDIQQSMTVTVLNLEDDLGGPILLGGSALADIFPYEALTSTAGSCTMAHLTQPHSETRFFPAGYVGSNQFVGPFAVDAGFFAGCVAVAMPNGVYACVEASSRSMFNVRVPSDAHIAQLLNLAASNGAAVNGLLVVRVFDNLGNTPVDAHVFFLSGSGNPSEADYVSGPDWSLPAAAGSGVGTEGIAIFQDAPGGPYFVQQPGKDPTYFSAGGADDPTSIATYTVFLP